MTLKSAIYIRRDNAVWLLNGNWSAGERFPGRPKSWIKTASEEGIPSDALCAVWLQEEQQVGWFVFGEKPVRGRPLAALAARRILSGQLPWVGIFCLNEDLWWCVVADSAGAIHPAWDVAGSRDEVMRALSDRAAELSSIRHRLEIDNPHEAWQWLLDDADAIRAIPTTSIIKKGVSTATMVGAAVAALAVVAVAGGGYVWWTTRQQQLAQVLQEQAERARQASLVASEAEKRAKETAEMQRIQAYWNDLPRPWQSAVAWRDLLDACRLRKTSERGWVLASMRCEVDAGSAAAKNAAANAKRIKVTRVWNRPNWATALSAPEGVPNASWDAVTSQTFVDVAHLESLGIGTNTQDLSRLWIGLGQQWAGIISIKASPFAPYQAPMPPNVSPEVAAKMAAPVLWSSAQIELEGELLPQPLWPILKRRDGFVPSSVDVEYSRSGKVLWRLQGVQYVTQ